MSDLFDTLVERLISVEGGYVNDPNDAGGETIWGITKPVARENGYAGAMVAMSREQAKTIYRAKYWIKPGLHLIAPLSAPVVAELLDTGVNMGTGAAAMFFQRALNVLNRQGRDYPDIAVDGGIGPASVAAFAGLLKLRGPLGEQVLLKALNCLQGARYIDLAESRAANEAFELGWLANRIGLAT